MKRSNFLKSIFGVALFSATSCQTDQEGVDNATLSMSLIGEEATDEQMLVATQQLRQELRAAWVRSEKMTLTNVEQMPPESFTFKYTDEAMTFSEQWRHCVIYTCGQLAGETGIENPYRKVKLPYQMPKERIIEELQKMYSIVRNAIEELSAEDLLAECVFAGETIPVWRLFYALENHIIHHRGQCIVYLRLNGVTPKGFYGW